MKRNTIKWRIFKYNLITIAVLIVLTMVIFNTAVRVYIEHDVSKQLSMIAKGAEETALRKGPEFFLKPKGFKSPPPPIPMDLSGENDVYRFYFMLDRSLREPLSLLNADYILADTDGVLKNAPEEAFKRSSAELVQRIATNIGDLKKIRTEKFMNISIDGTNYIAIIKPVTEKNSFGLGWIIIFSSIEKINQLQLGINGILLTILVLSFVIITIFSSAAAKTISAPFSSLNLHLNAIAERNFSEKIQMPVDDELQEFVNNINTLSEKLEVYDKAQKTFLQNASHEFRTPLMSIQSYAEGIQYDVIDKGEGVRIILDESRRMTSLVEDLLYLSRLDAIEESYVFKEQDPLILIHETMNRLAVIAEKRNIQLTFASEGTPYFIKCDGEKISRAIYNILSNSIQYANKQVQVQAKFSPESFQLLISDDGPGISEEDLANIFDRFYKGKDGNFGLGLAITKNIVERHGGTVDAENGDKGAIFKINIINGRTAS